MNDHITSLDLSNRGLTNEKFYEIISKYPNLQYLYCYNNKITSLDHLPASLQDLYCYNNQITSLDHLPGNLQILYCYNNQITSLDYLPRNLQILYCNSNQITSLDHLPASLRELYCNSNQITSLDHLPANLQKLYCEFNPIKIVLFDSNLYVKRSKYLRFLRNLTNTRKTHAYLTLRSLSLKSYFNSMCLPDDIIKHIVSFV